MLPPPTPSRGTQSWPEAGGVHRFFMGLKPEEFYVYYRFIVARFVEIDGAAT
jgi:hypothetical protein